MYIDGGLNDVDSPRDIRSEGWCVEEGQLKAEELMLAAVTGGISAG